MEKAFNSLSLSSLPTNCQGGKKLMTDFHAKPKEVVLAYGSCVFHKKFGLRKQLKIGVVILSKKLHDDFFSLTSL